MKFNELVDVYKEAPEGNRLKENVEKSIISRAKYKSSFGRWFQAYQTFADNPKLQKKILKKMIKNAEDFNQWMDIYVELEAGDKMKPEIEKIMISATNDLEELFTLYYVILDESSLVESVLEKISKLEAPLEKWAEIYERIPRKKEFSKIREIFISRMSQIVEK